ncbi:hypothetical protein BIV57_12980 [Mangrovactinospora gilvigrisea]|uniref:ABC transporter substrate-binding protein n=1 Tax=Mangrovactinospora gilvigrisea TaxID=1428644 RepID=A0A1J7BUD8_9ACTN|nr:extracellular solute-binding protein [Mangrovactinospora gilvigrisea]OIV37073.1 hypothetical protein BIV57_12980 [Mangrovactinospora gilvigrisea]
MAAGTLVGALALGGCGSPAPSGGTSTTSSDAAPTSTASTGGPVTLRLIAADYGGTGAASTKHYWSTVIGQFEHDHPGIGVDVQLIPWSQIDSQVSVMVKNNQVPDLLLSDSYASLASSGQLLRAQDVLSGTVRGDLNSTLRQAGSISGVQYGIPFGARPHLLVYNKDLFRKAGIESAPATWGELKDAAEKLKRSGTDTPYGMALATGTTAGSAQSGALAEATQWMLGSGASLTDGDGQLALGGSRESGALAWVQKNLVTGGLTGSQNPSGVNEEALESRFLAGKVGMMSADPSLVRRLTAASTGKGAALQYATAQMPGRTGAQTSALTTSDWMVAFKKNGNQDAVKQFLDFLYAPEQQAAFTDAGEGLLPTTGQGRDTVTAERGGDLTPWLDALRGSVTAYPEGATGWSDVESVLQNGTGKALTAAVGGGNGPAAVVERLRAAIAAAKQSETDT